MSGPAHQGEADVGEGPVDGNVSARNSNSNSNSTTNPSPAERLRRRLTLAPMVPMVPRDTEEPHRASTPLELLFDLCFVVAVSQAARELNSSLAQNDFGAIQGYLLVFFAIWLAWVKFTWFASGYDVDDVPYRILIFVQIVGVFILAAGGLGRSPLPTPSRW
jgi:hypothetical protein